jgi:PIN domain nuclease of toxin-antitoxin system
VTVLDASALVAFLLGEPASQRVEEILRHRPPPVISAVNLSETIDRLVRVGGVPFDDVNDKIDLLMAGGLEVNPYWLPDCRRAAALRAAHYDRATAPISLADCACLATAIALTTDLATTDPILANVARSEGIRVVALPDSAGRLP